MTDLNSITNVCRICLNAPETSQLLFLNSTIVERIDFVGGSLDECESDMRLPQYICSQCEVELEFVYNFLAKIKLSKLRIKSLHMSAQHKEDNHEDNIQPFIKTEHIDLDFNDEFQMEEDIKVGCDQNNEDQITNLYDIQTPTIESNFITCHDKIQISSVKSNWIDRSSVKFEASQIDSKCFTNISKLHLNTSQHDPSLKDNPNTCHLCFKTYSTRANLLRHIREHQGRRFDCTYENCKSFFTQRSSLKLHLATHTGEKPFHCYLCNKRFTQPKSLTLHLRIHSGYKPYSCDDCHKCFNQKTNLLRHYQSDCKNAKPKRFQCFNCSKHYSSKQSLHRHYAQIHDRDNKEMMAGVKIEVEPCAKLEVESCVKPEVTPCVPLEVEVEPYVKQEVIPCVQPEATPCVELEVKPVQKLKINSSRFIITPE